MFEPSFAPPSVFDHLFWLLGQPETNYIILPGLLWAIIAGGGRQRLLSGLGLATAVAGGLFVWIKAAGYSFSVPEAYFIPAAMLIPVAGTALWIAKGREDGTGPRVPTLWMFGAISLYMTGGMTSFLLTGTDRGFSHGSYIDQHLRYALTLSVVFVLCAGWYRFFPTITGYSYSIFIAKLHFVVAIAGLYILFFISLLMGTSIRVISDEDMFERLNLFSSLGAWISLLAFLIFLYGAVAAVWRGQKAA